MAKRAKFPEKWTRKMKQPWINGNADQDEGEWLFLRLTKFRVRWIRNAPYEAFNGDLLLGRFAVRAQALRRVELEIARESWKAMSG